MNEAFWGICPFLRSVGTNIKGFIPITTCISIEKVSVTIMPFHQYNESRRPGSYGFARLLRVNRDRFHFFDKS